MTAPHNITFYCRPVDDEGVHHTFPVDSAAKHDSAKSWASTHRYNWTNHKVEPLVFEFPNSGFDHVTIDSLDIRGEGGRAYQVILDRDGKKFQVDMREATLMDVIRNTGIEAGGRLNGSFCFAKAGSQTQLIREGSEVHKQALADRELRETYTQRISNKDLKPGYEYSTVSGKSAVFLGVVYTTKNGKTTEDEAKPVKHLLWSRYAEDKVKKYLEEGIQGEDRGKVSAWYFDLTTSHSYTIEGKQYIDAPIEDTAPRVAALGKADAAGVASRDRISYWEQFTDSYRLEVMTLDKKAFKVDKEYIQRCKRKVSTSRYGW